MFDRVLAKPPERPDRPPVDHGDVIEGEYDRVSIHVVGSIQGGILTLRLPKGAAVLISTTGHKRDIVVTD